MRYHVTVRGREIAIEVEGDRVTVGGRTVTASLSAISGTPLRLLMLDGRPTELVVETAGRGLWSFIRGGERTDAEVVDERTRHIRSLTVPRDQKPGAGPIKAPMPGLVLRVLVGPGDQVTAGRGVIVLEAMKMENELTATADGTVSRVLVGTGQAVEKGQPLVELKSS
ncbi:MAG: biotin attachment protein [Gemmatimonadales bacterium]|nr:biotin attachment protein [Gemmatimonadales bacterium]